jgi:dTDP-4-amino-4,6-dideoxygalactose transaminase
VTTKVQLVRPPAFPGGDRIPFAGLDRQHAAIEGDLRRALERVIGTSGFILGEEVAAFEAEFADYVGVRDCVGVASGTAALTIALLAAGIGPEEEVIVPAMTFAASALAVIGAGATPVLCDVRESDGLIDLDSARARLTARTTAIMPVHLYGQLCEMDAIGEFASAHGLAVIEDAAQAHGAGRPGARAGSFGLAAGFSFYPSKNLGALGDGGAICTDDPGLAQKARRLRDLGRGPDGVHYECGFNERLDGLQAAVLRLKLPGLDAANDRRRRHADRYRELLPPWLRMLEAGGSTSVHHLLPVRCEDRDGLREHLGAAGVETGIHYSPALDGQPALAGAISDDPHPVAARWAEEELSLPIFAELREDEVERVAEVAASFH